MMIRTKTAVVFLIFLGLLVYFNSLFNGFIIGDDEDQILNHPYVRSVANIPRFFLGSTYFRPEGDFSFGLYYRPLMLSVYSLIHAVVGFDPLFFHFVQLIFHSFNAVLMFLLLNVIVSPVGALLAAVLFLVHPVNSDTVLHASNLQDVLFLFFGMLALVAVQRVEKITLKKAVFIGVLFLLSLLSKETGAAFILMTLVWAFLFQKDALFKLIGAAAVSSGIYFYLRFVVARIPLHAQTISILAQTSLTTRLLTLPKILIQYFATIIWPWTLTSSSLWLVEVPTLRDFFLPLFIIFIFLLIVYLAYRAVCEVKLQRYFFFFFIWMVVGLVLHSNLLVVLDQTLANRWLYFSFVGMVGIFTMVIISMKLERHRLFLILTATVIALFSIRTVVRSFDWRNSWTLVRHDLNVSPENYYLANNLGTLFIRDKQYAEAKPHIEASIARYPFFGNLNNLAIILAHERDFVQARQYFEQALVASGGYGVYQNYVNVLLYMEGDYESVKKISTQAIQQYPNAAFLWVALAQAEYADGEYDSALRAAQRAYALNPDSPLITEVYTGIVESRPLNTEQYIEQ